MRGVHIPAVSDLLVSSFACKCVCMCVLGGELPLLCTKAALLDSIIS